MLPIPRESKKRREMTILELEKRGQKRVRFGNQMEKLEKDVIKHCRFLRVRADKKAFRRKVSRGVSGCLRGALGYFHTEVFLHIYFKKEVLQTDAAT